MGMSGVTPGGRTKDDSPEAPDSAWLSGSDDRTPRGSPDDDPIPGKPRERGITPSRSADYDSGTDSPKWRSLSQPATLHSGFQDSPPGVRMEELRSRSHDNLMVTQETPFLSTDL